MEARASSTVNPGSLVCVPGGMGVGEGNGVGVSQT